MYSETFAKNRLAGDRFGKVASAFVFVSAMLNVILRIELIIVFLSVADADDSEWKFSKTTKSIFLEMMVPDVVSIGKFTCSSYRRK
jgi:hypothetical protein